MVVCVIHCDIEERGEALSADQKENTMNTIMAIIVAILDPLLDLLDR